MKQAGGHIVNVSSIAGFIGIFGYTAYSASKFGIIGLSECLRNEMKPYGIKVSVLCPPDTDTPGFVRENLSKPEETKAISGNAGLMSPEQVAQALIKGMNKGAFLIIPGIEGKLIHLVKHLFPGFVGSVLDYQVRKYRKDKALGAG
jgi:short-subunit dehydrogenase